MYADNIPNNQWLSVEAHLDNAIGHNSLPVFANHPIDYICAGDEFCFLQGAAEPDGDSLVYSLVNPLGYNGVPINFSPSFDAQNPIASTPAISLDSVSGTLCLTPDSNFIGVLAMKVDEYRNGQWIGSTMRDMRFNILNCSNTNPELSGIDGSSVFFDTTCAGSQACFDIFSFDPDSGQTLSMAWNHGIDLGNAAFTVSSDSMPSGHFCWTPEDADTSDVPYCFDVTVRDDHCPYVGQRLQTYCLVVRGTTADATILPIDAFCPNDNPAQIPAVEPDGFWSGTGITDSNNGIFDPSTAGIGAHSIIHQSFSDCDDFDTTTIYVDTAFDAGITSFPDSICEVEMPVHLQATDLGGFWNGSGIADSTIAVFDPGLAGVGSHQVIYRIGSACGDADTVTIHVLSAPDPAITTTPLAYCISEAPFNLTSAENGGIWSGNGITDSLAGTFDPTQAGVGTHQIIYTVSNTNCTNIDTVMLAIAPEPNPTITPVAPVCDNDPGFYLHAANLSGTWSGQGITLPGSGYFNPASVGAGTHQIIYTITGTCSAADTIDIVVIAAPQPEILTQLDTVCQSAGITNLLGNPPGGTWTGIGVNGQTGEFDPSVGNPSWRQVHYVYDDGTCDATAFMSFLVISSPSSPQVSAVDTLCPGAVLTGLIANGNGLISWYSDSLLNDLINTGNQLNESISFTDTVWATTSGGGCESSATEVIIPFHPGIQVSFDDDPEIVFAGQEVHFLNTSGEIEVSEWDFGDGSTAGNSLNGDQYHTYQEPGTYTVTLIGQNVYECADTAYLDIEISEPSKLNIPSVFTPNNDGFNDQMTIDAEYITTFKAQIFNRWGSKIYEWNDLNQGWDGKDEKGLDVSPGTYYYIISGTGLDGQVFKERGFVELIR